MRQPGGVRRVGVCSCRPGAPALPSPHQGTLVRLSGLCCEAATQPTVMPGGSFLLTIFKLPKRIRFKGKLLSTDNELMVSVYGANPRSWHPGFALRCAAPTPTRGVPHPHQQHSWRVPVALTLAGPGARWAGLGASTPSTGAGVMSPEQDLQRRPVLQQRMRGCQAWG